MNQIRTRTISDFNLFLFSEYHNKQLLQRKSEEMIAGNCRSSAEFQLSLVQLHLQKNVFQIIDRGEEFKVLEGQTEEMKKGLPPKTIPTQSQLPSESILMSGNISGCSLGQENRIIPSGLVSTFPEDATEEFKLDLVRQSTDGDEISDDSDYGSPR